MQVGKVNVRYDRFLSTAILVSLSVSTFLMFPSSFTAHASSSSPLLGGWGGTRLEDTVQHATAPRSQVFSGERQSNFEQIAIRQLGARPGLRRIFDFGKFFSLGEPSYYSF